MKKDDVTSSYRIFFHVKNEIIYLMQKKRICLSYTYIHLWIKEIITKRETINIYKIVDEFIRDQGVKLPFIVIYYNRDSRNRRESRDSRESRKNREGKKNLKNKEDRANREGKANREERANREGRAIMEVR